MLSCRLLPTQPQPAAPSRPLASRSDAFFCFHTINAFEDESGCLCIDLCGYDDGAGWFQAFSLPHMRSGAAQPPRVDVRRRVGRPAQSQPAAGSARGLRLHCTATNLKIGAADAAET